MNEAVQQTWKEKLLFYTTAFFILLGTFSLFAFLFLVPFVIDPAFTTIFMEFDETPALCITVDSESRQGASNCTWSSCREGCTKEVYDCTQIRVNYRRTVLPEEANSSEYQLWATEYTPEPTSRSKRGIRDYDYADEEPYAGPLAHLEEELSDAVMDSDENDEENDLDLLESPEPEEGFQGNESLWYYKARLYPNVKGCGYPPALNCSIFLKKYNTIGNNFSCYYSKVDRGIVISELDMWQVYMNLVYAMAIPIPSFIISVIYLTFAYFKIYNEDEETELLEENAEAMDGVDGTQEGMTPVPNAASLQPVDEVLTPGSEVFREDLASFGHQYKVAMADELSRDSFAVPISNSISIPGNLSKTMMTSISTPAGEISDL